MREYSINYRPDIDGLRCLAILSVVAFHASPLYMPGGFVGVDIFFVISGYLITGIILGELKDNKFSLSLFYAKRARRILPTLLATFVTIWGLGWAFMSPSELAQLGRHVIAGSLFFENFQLLSEVSYFDVEAKAKPFLHLWSLGVEEQFYIVWPLILLLIWKEIKYETPLVVGIFFISLAAGVVLVKPFPDFSFYSPNTRFWELMVGALLAVKVSKNWAVEKSSVRNLLSVIGFCLMVGSIFLFNEKMELPGYLIAIPVFGAGLFIAAGSDALVNNKIFSRKLPVYIGLISYPLYLWHVPLLSLVYIYQPESYERLYRYGAVLLSFFLAIASYHFIESPIRKIPAAKAFKFLIGGLLGMVFLGLLTVAQKGYPSRFNAETRSIIKDFEEEFELAPKYWRAGYCFLKTEKDIFSNDCLTKGSPSILLWGDSYAAQYYHGLRTTIPDAQNKLTQLTGLGCPPILNFIPNGREYCIKNNQSVSLEMERKNPDIAILSGGWFYYASDPTFFTKLSATLDWLMPNAKQVIVIGPVPFSNKFQVKYAIKNSESKSNKATFPGNDLIRLREIDSTLQKLVQSKGGTYISPLSEFCGETECQLFIVNEAGERKLVSFDLGHLTSSASVHYAKKLILPAMYRAD